MTAEIKEKGKDYWDGDIFILAGQKYGVGKTLSTICAGAVRETSPDGIQTTPAVVEVVAKLPIKENIQGGEVTQQKHAGGRPKKEGEVHRSTTWRRQKETQGALI